jgi:hypothetical protein
MMLIVEQGADAGKRVRLDRGLVTIGRGAACDLVLNEPQASRQHAQLRRYGDQWLIADLGSTNGTFVDGSRLRAQMARPLAAGMRASIGGTTFLLQGELEDLIDQQDAGVGEVPAADEPVSSLWGVLTWFCRGLVVIGCVLLILSAFTDWIEVQVQLPVVPVGVNKAFSGMDSGHAWLFVGVGVVVLLLVVMDILSRRFGLAAGMGEAMVPALAVVAIALEVRRYYQAAASQKFLGISLVDVVTKYAKDLVEIRPLSGVYMLGAGLGIVIVGGLLRLAVAGLDPSGS